MHTVSKAFRAFFCCLFVIGFLPSFAQSTASPSGLDLTSSFDVKAPTQVPNTVLKSGAYTIKVVDHLADRVVLQISKADGRAETTFLGVENSSLRKGSQGPLLYDSHVNGAQSLRGFSFPGGSSVEFVYPKQDAVAIAKANQAAILAIDPSSEGRVEAKHLSKNDLTMVTLWTLSPTRVGPPNNSEAAIAASRYLPPTPSASTQQPTQIASNTIPAEVQGARSSTSSLSQRAPRIHTKTVSSLPHTASNFPLLLLGGLFLFLCAGLLHSVRRLSIL